MALMPTLLIGSCRESALLWTSAMGEGDVLFMKGAGNGRLNI
jgi:hypothetical protein